MNAPDFPFATPRLLILSCLLMAGAIGAVGHVRAADTPVNMVSTDERLGNARAAIAARDYTRAIVELRAALSDAPGSADAHNLMGYSLRKQARPDLKQALFHYGEALRIDPRHKGAHEYIGEAYLMLGQPERAEQHLQTLERLCGAAACEERDDLKRAIAQYRKNPPPAR